MPAKKFRFVSPGVQIKEIDKSQLPALPDAIGPVVIGRTSRGPGMVPVTVQNYEEFVEKFGAPSRGAGSSDVWRNGNTTGPLYASYAAEAYLKNSSPLTVVRLLGTQHPNASATVDGATAGWKSEKAYGLFVSEVPSAPGEDAKSALAAIIYSKKDIVFLQGKDSENNNLTQAPSGTLVQNIGASYEFKAEIDGEEVQFNFNESSAKYIRKVLNTNPTLTNSDVTENELNYWLGETFETYVKETLDSSTTGSTAGSCYAFIAELHSTTFDGNDFTGVQAQPGKSGWLIGQDLNALASKYDASKMPKLFRFVASEGLGGDWEQGNIKISIFNIKAPVNEYQKYGTFSVGIRKISDIDSSPEYVEVFTNCNLDPTSPDYVAAKIGDRHLIWDTDDKRHREMGEYPNVSRYVRVEMNPTIEQGGLDPELLPFGFLGHPRYKGITAGDTDDLGGVLGSGTKLSAAGAAFVGSSLNISFPAMKLRVSASDAGTLDDTQAYFGVVPNKGLGIPLKALNQDFVDLARCKPSDTDSYDEDKVITETAFIFSLDDLVITGSAATGRVVYWQSGSRQGEKSFTSLTENDHLDGKWDWTTGVSASVLADKSYKELLAAGFDQFTLPLFGGTDGLDVTEREPFRNSFTNDKLASANYAVNSLERAIDSVREPEVLNMNLLVMPGITNKAITKKAMDTCELRGDALAIIDIPGGYEPSTESANEEKLRIGSVKDTIEDIEKKKFEHKLWMYLLSMGKNS